MKCLQPQSQSKEERCSNSLLQINYQQVQWLWRLERIKAAVIVRQDDLMTIFNIATKKDWFF